MDIRPLVEAVMETAGKIKNDNMSGQDFYKLEFGSVCFVLLVLKTLPRQSCSLLQQQFFHARHGRQYLTGNPAGFLQK